MAKLKDIAKTAEVSVPTASLILSKKGERYSAQTRERVLRVAEELGFRPDILARGLQQQKSFLIGVLFSGVHSGMISDFLRGMMERIKTTDYAPVVFSSEDPAEEVYFLERARDRRIDGLIVNVTIDRDGNSNADTLVALQKDLPLIELFGCSLPGVHSVNFCSRTAGQIAVRHMLDRGSDRIALLTHDRYDYSQKTGTGVHSDAYLQYCGCKEELAKEGKDLTLITHSTSSLHLETNDLFAGGELALDQILEQGVNGVVCYSDVQACGLLSACKDKGIAVPGDLAVIGCQDMSSAGMYHPRMTTVKVSAWAAGKAAASILFDRMSKKEVENILIKPELVVRQTA